MACRSRRMMALVPFPLNKFRVCSGDRNLVSPLPTRHQSVPSVAWGEGTCIARNFFSGSGSVLSGTFSKWLLATETGRNGNLFGSRTAGRHEHA